MKNDNTLQAFAYNKEGQLVSIRDVQRGQDCLCICPACGEHLVAKQGEVRAWHFAHKHGNECENAGESSLHLACKEVVAKAAKIVKPGYGSNRQYLEIDDAVLEATVETDLGKITPDITILSGGEPVFIEIAVTHAINAEKQAKITHLKVPTIEIFIDPLMMEEWDWETINNLVLHDNLRRHWVYEHERTEPSEEKLTTNSYQEEVRMKINDVPVRVRLFEWGVTVWSGYNKDVNFQVKKIMRSFGGRWQPHYKNWSISGARLFEPVIEALMQDH